MKIVCAWCRRQLGEKKPYEDESETHGICMDCLSQNFPHHCDRILRALEVENIEEIYKIRKEVR